MAYPRKLLADNEDIAFELRPHWRALFIPVFWLIVILAAAGFLIGKMGAWIDSPGATTVLRWVLAGIAVFLLIFLFIRPFVAWFTTQYVFTNRRIIVRTGLVARRGRDMPLSKVNDVIFEHTVLERMLNCGTLVIESAAENGSLVVANVPNVEHVQREVYRLHDEDDAFRSARQELYRQQAAQGMPPEDIAREQVSGTMPQPAQPQPTQQVPPAQPQQPVQPTTVQPQQPAQPTTVQPQPPPTQQQPPPQQPPAQAPPAQPSQPQPTQQVPPAQPTTVQPQQPPAQQVPPPVMPTPPRPIPPPDPQVPPPSSN